MRIVQLGAAALGALALAACADREPVAPSAQFTASSASAADRAQPGAVYTLNNSAAGNAVLAFDRAPDGTLAAAGAYPTGGLGTGGGLGSQGALVLSPDGRYLLAVDAGSDEVSVLRVRPGGLELVTTVPSGGDRPTSVTVHQDLVYVLNAGGVGNIAGFRLGKSGALFPIAGSARPLSSGAAAPAQIEFSPNGRVLVVTERATNVISTYLVGPDGTVSGPTVNPSAGATPFGFAFDNAGRLLVSEAFGGAPDASTSSSYALRDDGTLTLLSGPVPTTETAACWLVVTSSGRFAYVTNTGSGSVSGYAIETDGRLTLLDADGRTGETGAGSSPIDAALDVSSRFLYTLNAGNGSISAFAVGSNGSLASLAGVAGLPAGAVGLAAR
ncbi:MAG: beta-propeller fold lactonase family protein [Gemmatimonadetes bacterium]|nr:beta-propeller fold lactonase family protein [Gemmatimonadota bacterium]